MMPTLNFFMRWRKRGKNPGRGKCPDAPREISATPAAGRESLRRLQVRWRDARRDGGFGAAQGFLRGPKGGGELNHFAEVAERLGRPAVVQVDLPGVVKHLGRVGMTDQGLVQAVQGLVRPAGAG